MSRRALPIQFLNLGGEMAYIIDQRLTSQNVPLNKAQKVRDEILNVMLGESFVDELFQPQATYARSALHTVFEKLAHASIMKMNEASMNKLFDLMLMSLKHQLVLCHHPRSLFWVTLNHLDSMMGLATLHSVKERLCVVRQYFVNMYINFDLTTWMEIRRELLLFVQDIKIRVSVFLRSGIQDHLGRLVIPLSGQLAQGVEIPGTIRCFDEKGTSPLVTLFPSGGSYTSAGDDAFWLQIGANRGVILGLNLFNEEQREQLYPKVERSPSIDENSLDVDYEPEYLPSEHSGNVREELNLLAHLIGPRVETKDKKEFKLNLFPNERKEQTSGSKVGIIQIEGRQRSTDPHLGNILGKLQITDDNTQEEEEEDLLQLLDST